ncbi:glycine-rich protein [Nocardioides sp. URHA0020]|uniref:glycine-rich protein n=1 Tax=Nocardioides sp. URHA0020 TaxID=1380392 RepID=UPI00068743D2|nr:glycine-rich protein [Nocardioides sp. URHA0020]
MIFANPGTSRARRSVALIAALLLTVWLTGVDLGVAPPALGAAAPTTQVFTTPGVSVFTVPAGVTEVEVEAVGAAGGTCYSGNGGHGASVTAVVSVTAGSQLRVGVGQAGPAEATCMGAGTPGGTPGGGGAGGPGDPYHGATGGAGGGGASLISLGTGAPTSASALVVAGAGGGAAYGIAGGDAGSPGADGDAGGGGAGTQVAGGAGGSPFGGNSTGGVDGSAFFGGAGGHGDTNNGSGGGGGGGGYFGGGGGGGTTNYSGGGGGGSSYVTPTGDILSEAAPTSSVASVTITYPPVYPLPRAVISSPTTGGTYLLDESVITAFSCTEATDGPGLASCDDSHGTASVDGGAGTLDTSWAGTHTYTVTATSSGGDTGTDSISYTVVYPPPSAQISLPTTGGTYVLGQSVATAFTCAEGTGAPGLTSCDDSHGAATVDGGAGTLDTSSVGPHTYTVTAASSGGDTGTDSISYTVVYSPPSAHISSPSTGHTYPLGMPVRTAFSCAESSGGPGLVSCQDSHGAATLAGGTGTLDTTTAGAHTYAVTARSSSGLSRTRSISYTITPARVTIRSTRARVAGGRAKIVVGCAGATVCRGTITIVRGRTVVATGAYRASRGTSVVVRTRLTRAGSALVKKTKGPRLSAQARATVVGGVTARRTIVLKLG